MTIWRERRFLEAGGQDNAAENGETAKSFTCDLADRLADRIQLTSDGFGAYRKAVAHAFGDNIDFAQLVKVYKDAPIKSPERRYSPAVCTGAHKDRVSGKPALHHISTSHVERSNLSMRMSMRRFTRLTNAHSEKIENHCHALALYFLVYNWVRPHGSLDGKTPAMVAKLTDKAMTMADVVNAMDVSQRREQLGIYSN